MCTIFENSSRMQVRKHVFTNTQRRKFSRMTRPILGDTPSSREQVCSGKGIIGPTLGVIQTGSATQRNQNARTFGERYIECTLIIEEKWQEHQLCRCITICSPFPALFLGLGSPNRVPRSMLLHFLWKLREREFIHCGFRSCISYDDKGPPVIVIANCTTETTGATTLYVNDLDIFVDFQFLKESPAERSLEHCARRVVFRLRGVQVSQHISSWMWDNIECKKTDNYIRLVVHGVQSADHQTRLLGDWKQTRAAGDHELEVETDWPERRQRLTEGLTGRSSSSTDVSPVCVEIPLLAIGRDGIWLADSLGDVKIADHKVSQWRSRDYNNTNMQWFCKILQLNGLEVIQAKPHQLKRRWEVFETSQEENLRANCTNSFSGISKSLREAESDSWRIHSAQIRNT